MGHPFPFAQLAAQALDFHQPGRHHFLHFLGQHMPLHLQLAQHHAQDTGEIRYARGQRQVDQLDAGRHRQPGIADHQNIAMPQPRNDP
ncbi:hypothetical protein D3C79_776610 [compost metagenome]